MVKCAMTKRNNMFVNLTKLLQRMTAFLLVLFLFLIVFGSVYNQNSEPEVKHHVTKIISVPKKLIATPNTRIASVHSVDMDNTGNIQSTFDDSSQLDATGIILWWTPFIYESEYTKNCGGSVCFFTGNQSYFKHEKLKTLMFYGSNLDVGNMPIPRQSKHLWALFHEESPKNVPLLMYQSVLTLFNLTATFSQNSDFPLTLQYLEGYEKLFDRQYFLDVTEKNRLQTDDGLASVLYIQSICDTMSDRDAYVGELKKYVAVDSYGKCLNNNQNFPKSLTGDDYLGTIQTEEFYKFIARYKFVIAYENSACNDYITEKLWRPLVLGVVPIYFGAPNIQNWLPNNDSAILIENYESPKHLADHILLLNNNDEKYNRYLKHKIDGHSTNQMLQNKLKQRGYETNSLVEDFECFVCQKSVGDTNNLPNSSDESRISGDMCTENLIYPKMRTKSEKRKIWQNIFRQGKCEANLFNELVTQNQKTTKENFQKEILRRFNDHICILDP